MIDDEMIAGEQDAPAAPSAPVAPPDGEARSFSFDDFFGGGGEQPEPEQPPPPAEPSGSSGPESDEFKDWLKGLKT